jgi:ABC-type nitrate/sulfonate/bicarbonate transport system substrate-binding protein
VTTDCNGGCEGPPLQLPYAKSVAFDKRMKSRPPARLTLLRKRHPLKIGFLQVNDCAPIVAARELGYFKKYGLPVEIKRLNSWRELHDQMVHAELDGAGAPGALPFLMRLGLISDTSPCVSGLVLSLQGNAITVSRELSLRGVRDAASLAELMRRDRGKRTYTFGVDLMFSSSYFLLCCWLRQSGLLPLAEVRIQTVPPAQMFPMLKLGYLDGFCAGEPWNSVAVDAKVGATVSTSAGLAPVHPEKVLLVREVFARERTQEHELLIASLLEACAFCDEPRNREALCELLSRPEYVDAPKECLAAGLLGLSEPQGSRIQSLHGLNIFQRHHANKPTLARASWITGQLHTFFRWKQKPAGLSHVFRPDIFDRAKRLVRTEAGTSVGKPGSIAVSM